MKMCAGLYSTNTGAAESFLSYAVFTLAVNIQPFRTPYALPQLLAVDSHPVVKRLSNHTVLWRRTHRLSVNYKIYENILLSTTNKMQRYTIFTITVYAVHVSGGFSAHHQELKNCTHSIWYVGTSQPR